MIEVAKLYLDQTTPLPATPETTIPERFTPGSYVIRAQVCNNGIIEGQHPEPERANLGLDEAFLKHSKWHEHEKTPPCQPKHITPLLRLFIDHQAGETIIRPVTVEPASDPQKDPQMTTVHELPKEAKTLPSLYLVKLPKEWPQPNRFRRLIQTIFKA